MSPKDKASLDKIHAKYYGGKKKTVMQEANEKIAKAGIDIRFVKDTSRKSGVRIKMPKYQKETDREVALRVAPELKKIIEIPKILDMHRSRGGGVSCLCLMERCKAAGIKYFRVLNKEELNKVLDLHASGEAPVYIEQEIEKIQKVANTRWKSGWGKKARAAGKDHKE
jgi:hypothetical protein